MYRDSISQAPFLESTNTRTRTRAASPTEARRGEARLQQLYSNSRRLFLLVDFHFQVVEILFLFVNHLGQRVEFLNDWMVSRRLVFFVDIVYSG
jgi:hypothetical protein